jgi:Holliday junction resolvasome RuvABC DNA-binding subunit
MPSAEPSNDLHVALRRLGYCKHEVRRAVALCAAFPGASLEEQVRLALRHI